MSASGLSGPLVHSCQVTILLVEPGYSIMRIKSLDNAPTMGFEPTNFLVGHKTGVLPS